MDQTSEHLRVELQRVAQLTGHILFILSGLGCPRAVGVTIFLWFPLSPFTVCLLLHTHANVFKTPNRSLQNKSPEAVGLRTRAEGLGFGKRAASQSQISSFFLFLGRAFPGPCYSEKRNI